MHVPTPSFALHCGFKASEQDDRIFKYIHWDRNTYRPLILKYLIDIGEVFIQDFKLWVVILWMAVSNRYYLHEKVDIIRLLTSDTIAIDGEMSPVTDGIYTHILRQVNRKRKRE
jgi:hypothetical protein